MESEARLMMIDGGLPTPELQYEVIDRSGRMWRLDFAWPDQKFAVEYDGFDWHSDPDALRRDRQKRAALRDLGWTGHVDRRPTTSGGGPTRRCVDIEMRAATRSSAA